MKKRRAFKIFYSVVWALFLREVQVLYGSKRLGYLWAVVDPMIMIVVFSVVHSFLMKGASLEYDYPVFLATGFLAYNLFRSIVFKSMEAFNANRGLFVYKQVKPIDTIVARVLVEVFQISIVAMIFVLIGWYFGFDLRVENFNMVVLAVAWIVLFGFGLGVLFGVVGTFYENFKKIVTIAFMPLFFLSALFYTVESLPQQAREVILFNPVVHFMELIHGSYFYAIDTTYVNFEYMLYWTLVPLFLGLYFYRKSERKILSI